MAVYDDADPDARIQVFDRGRRVRVRLGTADPTAVSYRDEGRTVPEVPFREPLQVQAMDFIRCCGAGARPVADGWAGVAVVAVLEASNVSLQENGAPIPVDLPHLHLGSSLAVA
jgi:predicted dehydrogenase